MRNTASAGPTRLLELSAARAPAGAQTNARRDVVFATHPSVRARCAGGSGDAVRRPRRLQGRDAGAARGTAVHLSRFADLLHHQPVYRRGAWRDREVAALQQGDGLRARDRRRDAPHPLEHSHRRGGRAYIRLHDLQRLFRARSPGGRNAGTPWPRQGQEL